MKACSELNLKKKKAQMLLKFAQYIFIFVIMWITNHLAFAAEIVDRGPFSKEIDWAHTVTICGNIEKGDYQKFKQVCDKILQSNNIIGDVQISSIGGNVIEAMKIGSLIRKLYIITWSPLKGTAGNYSPCNFLSSEKADNYCNSSCFLIWAAGVERWGNVLGLHRPYFGKEYSKGLTASEAKAKYEGGSNIVKNYLYDMDIPTNIIDEMFKHSSKDIYFLDYKTAESLKHVPFFEEWIIANCNTLKIEEKNAMSNFQTKLFLKRKLSKLESLEYNWLIKKSIEAQICMMNKIREVQLNLK
jgi:hypothetical protein